MSKTPATPKTSRRDAAKAAHKTAHRASTPILPKLAQPRPAHLYPRERLFGLLDGLRTDHRIIWVIAEAGAGKTSLAASYLAERKLPVLWYQVDAGDGDIASFFYYLGLAAQNIAPRYKQPLPPLTPEYLGGIPVFARNFFREFFRRLPRRCVLVFDNYQDAPETSMLHDVLNIAMSEIPETLSMIVLSRGEPPSALARLRLCEHAACLDYDKMRLTREETAVVAATRRGNRNVDPELLGQLYDRTQGWVAGVVLMLEQAEGMNTFDLAQMPAGRKLLFDYFAGEVLSRCELPLQDFLLKCALLPQLTPAMAQSLTGFENAFQTLEDMVRRNYFTLRLAGSEPQYQFHPLFRSFLVERGHAQYSPAERRALLQQASSILLAAGQVDDAAELMREGGDEAGITALIEQQAPVLVSHGRLATLESWLRSLPQARIESQPWLSYWLGICRMPSSLPESRRLIECAYSGFKQAGQPLGRYLALTGIFELFNFEWDDHTPLDRWIEEVKALRRDHPLEHFPQVAPRMANTMVHTLTFARSSSSELPYWATRAETMLMEQHGSSSCFHLTTALLLYYCWIGDLGRLRELILNADACLSSQEIGPLDKLICYLGLAQCWVMGDTASARRWAARAIQYGTGQGILLFNPLYYAQMYYACTLDNDMEGAETSLAQMQKVTQPGRRLDVSHYLYLATWLAIERGELAQARTNIEKALALSEQLSVHYPIHLCRIKLAEVLVEFSEFDAALQHLDQAEDFAARMGSQLLLFTADMTRAWVMLRAGRESECAKVLARVLARGREHGRTSYPSWHASHVAALCRVALEHGIEPAYVCMLIKQRKLVPPQGAPVPDAWPYPVKVHTLGRFAVMLDGKALAQVQANRKPLELLQALIALGGREVPEGRIMEALWTEAEGDAAYQSLKTNLHRLRKLLPEDTVTWSEKKLSLDARRCWVDVWALERELTRLDQMAPDDAPGLAALASRALGLYRGSFLAASAAPWALAARERLRGKTLRLVSRAAERIARCDPAAAVPVYEKAIELDPLHETLYQGLMHCHRQLGQPAEALHSYRRCRDILQRELGIPPSPATEALHQAIKTG